MIHVTEIKKDVLLEQVRGFAAKGARFVVMVCQDLGEGFSIDYYFNMSPGVDVKILRVTVSEEEEIPSISDIYRCAILNENEFQEFFGVRFSGIAIDYKGNMFLAGDSPVTPMRKPKSNKEEE